MIWGLVLLSVLGIIAALALWSRKRWREADAQRSAEDMVITESVRVDLATLKTIPALAPSVATVKWSKLAKQTGGRSVVGGIVVFGPQRLTWAPDDRARAVRMGSWQVAWSDIASGAVRTATTALPASLSVTLRSGETIELLGVNEQQAFTAVRRIQGIA